MPNKPTKTDDETWQPGYVLPNGDEVLMMTIRRGDQMMSLNVAGMSEVFATLTGAEQ